VTDSERVTRVIVVALLTLNRNTSLAFIVAVQPVRLELLALWADVIVGGADAVIESATVGG
jgi:hypothetical protein